MKDKGIDVFTPHILKYHKGDLIIKEGDYGISIYKVVKGKILIYSETEGMVIPLATLGEGEIIGEMLFLKKTIERRSASAKAIEDSEIEIWHPNMLTKEYDKMPPVIKYIANQALGRLVRMNKTLVQLTTKKQKQREVADTDIWAKKRQFYRKKLKITFSGWQINSLSRRPISGYIADISLGGAGLEISGININKNPFKIDNEFLIKTILPNGKDLEFQAKLVSVKKGKYPATPFFGMSFTELTDTARKDLGFFLMP